MSQMSEPEGINNFPQVPGGAGANNDETSSNKSAAPTRTSVERSDERRVVKYVLGYSYFRP